MRHQYLDFSEPAPWRRKLHAIILSGFLCASSGAMAQVAETETALPDTPEALAEIALLEAEITASTTEESALQFAQQQIDGNDLTGATTTLERYLITDPESVPARIEYAIALCRLDDLQAGQFEVAKLAGAAVDETNVQRLQASCQIAPSQMSDPQDQ